MLARPRQETSMEVSVTRVLFHYRAPPALARRLAELAGLGIEVTIVPPDDAAGLEAALAEMEVLWHVLAPVDAGFIAAAPKLRLIQKWGVGLNTIDLDAARARGIEVANMPGTNSRAVAEHTLLLMLACLRRLHAVESGLRQGSWTPEAPVMAGLGELSGRRVGLVGMGAVPMLLAPILTAMGAEPVYWSRRPKPAAPARFLELEELLTGSDIVSLHLPLTPETEGLVDLRRIKRGAILVNTARGGLIDEAALLAALKSGRIAAAGLDVFAVEPVAEGHPFLTLPNVTLTPHLAWLTGETLDRSLDVAVENVRHLAAGEKLRFRCA
jgi:phosphoglycerate dehydrogenase-like enzyme